MGPDVTTKLFQIDNIPPSLPYIYHAICLLPTVKIENLSVKYLKIVHSIHGNGNRHLFLKMRFYV